MDNIYRCFLVKFGWRYADRSRWSHGL